MRSRHSRFYLELPVAPILVLLASVLAVGCNHDTVALGINLDGYGSPTPTDGTPSATDTPATGTPSDSPTPGDPSPTPTATPIPVVDAFPGNVVINEIMVNPRAASDTLGEWFEVHNTTESWFDLTGWVLTDHEGRKHTIDPVTGTLLLEPGAYLVLGRSINLSENGQIVVNYAYSDIAFDNSGTGGLSLSNNHGVIDAVVFDLGGSFPTLEGHTLSLGAGTPDTVSNDNGANWCASFIHMTNSSDFGTPGRVNQTCKPDVDGDYYTSEADCDDSKASVNSGQAEVASNGIDDNCDTQIDEVPAYLPGSVIITEIMYDPGFVADEAGEWFEIYNTTGKLLDLKDWVIGNSTETHVVLSSVAVPPGVPIVLGNNGNAQANGGLFESYVYPGLLLEDAYDPASGFADVVRLMYANTLIDEVAYDDGLTFPASDKASIQLSPKSLSAADNDLGANWCASYTGFGSGGDYGTPTQPNKECIVDADLDGYNETLDCNDNNPAVNPGATEIAGNSIDDDCDGSVDEKVGVPGQVIVSELMIDSSAVTDGYGEYIELYNTTAVDININGWVLTDNGAEAHTINNGGQLVVKAGSYLVLGVNAELASNGGAKVDYVYGTALELDNTADSVVLKDGGTIIDQVSYDKNKGWTIPKGKSLGLSPAKLDAKSNDTSDNWCSSFSPLSSAPGSDKGTPDKANDACP